MTPSKCSCDCDSKCCSEENCDSSSCKCKERPEYDVVNYWQDEELKPERKTTHWMKTKIDRKRDIDKYCKCNCEPRCCTLKSTDIDVEDCSSILSSCTGENCGKEEIKTICTWVCYNYSLDGNTKRVHTTVWEKIARGIHQDEDLLRR